MKKDLRNEIVEKAAQVFNQYGYRKTTLNDIAHAVGKRKSSVYYYFAGKDEIFKAVIRREAENLREELFSKINTYTDPVDKFKCYVTNRMLIYKKASSIFRALASGYHEPLPYLAELRQENDQLEVKLLQELLEEGAQQNMLTVKRSNLVALAIVTALKSVEQPIIEEDNEQEIETILNQLLEILLKGILTRTEE